MVEDRDAGLTAWLRRLEPGAGARGGRLPVPASSERRRADVAALLGPGPVAWAVELGEEMARAIIAEVPQLGGGQGPFETLRMGTESAVLSALVRLADPDVGESVTDEALTGDRDFVHRRIHLGDVLRGIRIGHAWLAPALLSACRELVPVQWQAEVVGVVSERLFDFIDVFASRMTAEYTAEHERWALGAAAAREELVRRLLDSGDTGTSTVSRERAEQQLGYRLDARHLAVVACCASPDEESVMRREVSRYLRAAGAAATLFVPIGACGVWAWGGGAVTGLPVADDGAEAGSVRLAVGSVHAGIEGFRRSHQQAARAARILEVNPAFGGRVLAYSEVRLASLFAQYPDAARTFVRDVLGPLAGDAADKEQLRETLRAYLRTERSLAAAAAQLNVARNTVTYRVKRAQEFLGFEVGDRLTEVLAALEAAHTLGPAVLAGPEADRGAVRSTG